MSQHAYTCIEQLDLAARQLMLNQPSYARFALILSDNVIELITHKVCADLLSYDDMWIKLGKPKYTPRQREDALGNRFDRKIKFLVAAEKIDQNAADFINICHRYRNELYHAGLRHNDIIQDIAWHYHDLAISFFHTVNPNNSYYSGAPVTEAVALHTNGDAGAIMFDIDSVIKSLRRCRPEKRANLSEALSRSALQRVKDIEENLDFLMKNDPQKREEHLNIIELQFYDYLSSDDIVAKTVWGKVKTVNQRKAAISFLRETWEPKYDKNPLPNFMLVAETISRQKTDVSALRYFEKFKIEIQYFSNLIEEAAIALDGYIQNEIDRIRGK